MSSLDTASRSVLDRGPWFRDPAPFGVLRVQGPDAADFLQRLCTQEVLALAEGQCVPAAFLDPKGKLMHTCAVGRLGDGFVLETEAHQQDGLRALLDRYHFTERLSFAVQPWGCREWVAASAPPVDLAAGHLRAAGDGVALHTERRGVHWLRVHGPGDAAAEPFASLTGEPLDDGTADLLRMATGLVKVGVDTEPGTLALEADLDDHVSRTKGCYTGQEIVARIDTYGHVNRKLVLLHLEGAGPIDAPVPLCESEDGVPIGRVMRALPVPGTAVRLGLGYLPRDFWGVGTRLRLGDGNGPGVEVVGFGA